MKIELVQVQKMLEWLKTKLYLDTIAQNARSRAVKRGQVYRCNFGCGIGSEMQKERPAVIIQNDVANSRSGNTIVIPITHDTSILPCVANITPQTDASIYTYSGGAADAPVNFAQLTQRAGNFLVAREEMPDFEWTDLAGEEVLGGRKGGVHTSM